MNTFLNVLWNFPFFGFVLAILTAITGVLFCISIIGLPIGLGLFQFSIFLFWPHGYAMVSKGDLELLTEKKRPLWWKIFALIIRILYFPVGLTLAVLGAFAGLLQFITIIGIPQGLVTMKSIGTYFNPVNKVRVPQAVADQIQEIKRERAIQRYAPKRQQPEQYPSYTQQPSVMPAAAAPTIAPSTPAAGQAASFCHNCGNPLSEGSKFCPKCGTQVIIAASIMPAAAVEVPQTVETLEKTEETLTEQATQTSTEVVITDESTQPAEPAPILMKDPAHEGEYLDEFLFDSTASTSDQFKKYLIIGAAALTVTALGFIVWHYVGDYFTSSNDEKESILFVDNIQGGNADQRGEDAYGYDTGKRETAQDMEEDYSYNDDAGRTKGKEVKTEANKRAKESKVTKKDIEAVLETVKATELQVTKDETKEETIEETAEYQANKIDPDQVYNNVEEKPQFPGGDAAMMKWLSDHVRYPAMAQGNNIQGRVVLSVVIDQTGSVGDVRVIRSRDHDLDKEAVRVVKTLPRFTPGKINGTPVKCYYNIPITFRLQ